MSRALAVPVAAGGGRWERSVYIGVAVAEALLVTVGFLNGSPFPALAFAAGLCFFLIAYKRPDIAWALVWIAVPFDVEVLLGGGVAVWVPTEPMIALALLAWLFRSLPRGRWRLPASPLHGPFAAAATFILLSAVWSFRPIASLKSWVMMGGYAAFGYLYYFQARCSAERRNRWLLLVAIVGAMWGIFGVMRVLTLGSAGLEAESVASTYAYGAFRPFFPEHGTYSAYLGMLLPATLLATMESRGGLRVIYGLSTLCIGSGIVLAFARAGWLAMAVVVPLTLFLWARWRKASRRLLVPAFLALGVVAIVAAFGVGAQLSRHAASAVSQRNLSNLERLNRWYTALSIARDHPLLGVGYGSYLDAYRVYRAKTYVTEQTYVRMGVHSEPLKLFCELGAVGFFVVTWFLIATVRLALRCFRHLPDAGGRMLALAAVAGLWTYFVDGTFNAYLTEGKVTLPFWIGIGVIASLGRGLPSQEKIPGAAEAS